MTTWAVRVWDAFLAWLGVQSRHRSSLTATRISEHIPRHYAGEMPTVVFASRRNGKLTALARHHGMTTVQASDLFRANLRHEPAPDTSEPRPLTGAGPLWSELRQRVIDRHVDTSRPRPGSLTEMGQKIADGLAPWTWTDRADDTIQLEPIRDEPHYGLIDYLDRYGSATTIGGAT